MNTLYILFLLTFLGYPVVVFTFSRFINFNEQGSKLIKSLLLFFLVHNILYYLGISIKGDYSDYFLFSTEYLLLCLMVCSLAKRTNIYLRIIKFFGIAAVSIGSVIGCIGVLLFPVISQGFETDKVFRFTEKGKSYETRRSSFETIGSIDTRYTFETYRTFNYFPIESKIDKTNFFTQRTRLHIGESDLQIIINESNSKCQIIFRSTNGQIFTKNIE